LALLNQVAHPAPLHHHCQDIMETLKARLELNNWEQFQQDRTIGDSPHSIFLNGFSLPDRRGLSHSRIVMLLSPHTEQSMPGISRRTCSEEISESSDLDVDRPPAGGL
jgi:hypothetical protein